MDLEEILFEVNYEKERQLKIEPLFDKLIKKNYLGDKYRRDIINLRLIKELKNIKPYLSQEKIINYFAKVFDDERDLTKKEIISQIDCIDSQNDRILFFEKGIVEKSSLVRVSTINKIESINNHYFKKRVIKKGLQDKDFEVKIETINQLDLIYQKYTNTKYLTTNNDVLFEEFVINQLDLINKENLVIKYFKKVFSNENNISDKICSLKYLHLIKDNDLRLNFFKLGLNDKNENVKITTLNQLNLIQNDEVKLDINLNQLTEEYEVIYLLNKLPKSKFHESKCELPYENFYKLIKSENIKLEVFGRFRYNPFENLELDFIKSYLNSKYIIDKSQKEVTNELLDLVSNIDNNYKNMIEVLKSGRAKNLEEMIECSKLDAVNGEQILKKLGSGVSGTTYLAYSNEQKKEIAIKIIDDDTKLSKNEATILYNLEHRNIVKIWNSGRKSIKKNNKEVYSILMEYVDGKTINELMQEHKTGLEEKIAIEYSGQLLSGIKYLINQNIFHKDLNTNNLKVNCKGIVKILDFGIASNNLEEENKYNRRYGGSNDLFSFGLITYKFLTGEHLLFTNSKKEKVEINSQDYANQINILKQNMRTTKGKLKKKYINKMNKRGISNNLQNIIIQALENETTNGESLNLLNDIENKINSLRIDYDLKSKFENLYGTKINDNLYLDTISLFKENLNSI